MKFKHGIFVGLFSGFALGAMAENAARKRLEGDKEFEALEMERRGYSTGWLAGKNFAIIYHSQHHPDCDECPH